MNYKATAAFLAVFLFAFLLGTLRARADERLTSAKFEAMMQKAMDVGVASGEDPTVCIGPQCVSCSLWGPPWGVDCKATGLVNCAGFCGTGNGVGCTGRCW